MYGQMDNYVLTLNVAIHPSSFDEDLVNYVNLD